MMPSYRGRLLLGLERLLWLIALGTLGVFLFVIEEGHIYQSYLNREFDNTLVTQQPVASALNSAKTLAPSSSPGRDAALPYLGRLEIPRLNISIMLLDGIDNGTLRHGIGHIPGTALPGEPGNAGIAGHRDTFFRGLAGIRHADEITVQTLDGKYHYFVDSIRVVEPKAIEVLADPGHPVLTLVTCYPFHLVGPAPKRFIVQAWLKK